MKKKILSILIVCSTIYLSGCVDLKAVNGTATQSVTALKKFDQIDATFTRFRMAQCSEDRVKNNLILRVKDIKCDSEVYAAADNLTKTVYSALATYFNALADLSQDNLTSFNTDPLKQSLKKGTFANINIDDARVEAYDKFAKAVLKLITSGYQKKKLITAIGEANEPLKKVIDILHEAMTNLETEYQSTDQWLVTVYQDLATDTALSAFAKRKATAEYYQLLDVSRSKQKQINVYAESLYKIKDAHQKLYDNRNRLKAKDVKRLLVESAGTIQELIDDFDKLKIN